MEKEEKEDKARFGIVNFERRRNPRFSVDLPVEYSRVDSSKFRGTGRTGNASERGMMLYLPEKLEIGQQLRVKLYFTPEPGLDSVEVLGQVAWSEFPFDKEGDHRFGIKILDISPEDLARLRAYLENLAHIKTPLRITP